MRVTPSQQTPSCTSHPTRALLHGGERARLPSLATDVEHSASSTGLTQINIKMPLSTRRVEHLPHRPPPYAIGGTTTRAMSVLAQATTSTSYAAPPPTTQHHAQQQQRLTLVIPSSTTSNATSNANANSTSFHTTPASGPANVYRTAPYTSLGSAVMPSYSCVHCAYAVFHIRRWNGLARCRWVGSGSRRSSRRGSGAGWVCIFDDYERSVLCDGLRDAVTGMGYATPAPMNGSATGTTAQYAPGSTTTYAPGTSSPTPQYTTLGRHEYLGGQVQVWDRGWWGSRTSTSTPSCHRPCRPHPQAPLCDTTPPPTRSAPHHQLRDATHRRLRRNTPPPPPTSHNPARIDRWRASPRPRQMTGASWTRGMRRWCMCLSHPRPASFTPTIMLRAAEQAWRMCRLRVVPADPSAHAYRPQQQSQQPQPQYGCVGGGGGGMRAVGRAERADVACAGGRVVAEVLGSGAGRGVSEWGTAAAVDAPDAVRDAPGTATPVTASAPAAAPQHQQYTPQHRPHQHQQHATPARAHNDIVDAATAAALCGLGAVESGVGEVVR
ncbi:hypothetical protein C8J57DRAFT_1531632 [Mycena rebaudengoi]|nr:hypothetical protein C8J57DRAFT_1531632 [Mycena rebaudengoi]